MAELMLGQPLFPGESGIDQLVEIIKVLGTPTRDQIRTMNPNYMEHKFPQIKPHPFNKVCASGIKTTWLDNLPEAGFSEGRSQRDRSDLEAAGVYTNATLVGRRCHGATLL
jgi:hypothetical protein